MPEYTRYHDEWVDWPDTSMPVTAAALNHIEDGIAAVANAVGTFVNARDRGVVSDWQTSLGAVITSGLKTLTVSGHTFLTSDIGKKVFVNQDSSSTKFYSTITGVVGGVATLADAAPSTTTNQRVRWGTDSTTALQAALDDCAASDGPGRELYLPYGYYRFTQLTIPVGVKLTGAGWGNYGLISPYLVTDPSNTLLHQLPGSECDAIVFESAGTDAFGKHLIGPFRLSDFIVQGPETNILNCTFTTGSGIAAKTPDGVAAMVQDGGFIDHVHVSFFPQDGFSFPGGGVPLTVEKCRAFYNGRYGFNYIDNNTQAVHFLDCSGDGNSEGLVRLKSIPSWAVVTITNLKSEKGDFYTTAGGHLQESAVIVEDSPGALIVINGLNHISSVPAGAATEAPGPAIVVKGSGVPQIVFHGVGERIMHPLTDTNQANAVVLRDLINSVDVPASQPHGTYGTGIVSVGKLGVTNAASGSTLGTVVKKIQVYDGTGTSLGYVPVYNSIT